MSPDLKPLLRFLLNIHWEQSHFQIGPNQYYIIVYILIKNSVFLLSLIPKPKQLVNGNRYRTTFEKTYPMSSYLAAWTVAPEDFGYLQTTTQRGKQIRVFARKDAVNAGLIDFALEMTKKSLDFYENVYFDPNLNAIPPKIGS